MPLLGAACSSRWCCLARVVPDPRARPDAHQSGPDGATDLAGFQIYETGFVYFDPGMASAMSIVLIAGLFGMIALQLRLLRVTWSYE